MGQKKQELKRWREMIELIPKMQEAVEKGFSRHMEIRHPEENLTRHEMLEKYHQPQEEVRKELKLLKNAFEIFHGKYTLEIIFILSGMGAPFFNDIKQSFDKISSSTLSKRLKFLERKKIIKRKVHKGQPLRVSYHLTDFGRGIFDLIIPILVYGNFHEQFDG